MWWDHDPGRGGWLTLIIGVDGFWILQQRFARGEIDAAEYRARLETLNWAS